MNKTLKVVLVNKSILSNGVRGPEYTPMTMSVEQMIQDMKLGKPTPKFAYAANISKIVTLEELEAMVEPILSADNQAALEEINKEEELVNTDEVIDELKPEDIVITEPGASAEELVNTDEVIEPAAEEEKEPIEETGSNKYQKRKK